MLPIRVGSVRFLNTRPLIEGLEALPSLSLVPAVPSHLAGMLESRQVDIALVSLIDAVRARPPLAILPAGMIGSDGPTLTVRLFSPVPPGQVEEVWADTDSHTSVALCRLLLERLYGVRPHVRDFNARERMPLGPGAAARPDPGAAEFGGRTALLLIGDKVVADPPEADRFPVQLDLGAAWKDWTGLPFVYAAWMCRADDAERPEINLAAGLLDRQRRHNQLRLDEIATRHAAAAGWPLELTREYLGTRLRYALGTREREAGERFLRECVALNLAPSADLDWRDWRPGALQAAGVAG